MPASFARYDPANEDDERRAGAPGPAMSAGAVVLFDGTCAFCEGSVKFIARRDPAGYFRFGASQSPRAAELLAAHGVTRESARSIVLIENGHVWLRSTATLRIARRLRWPWPIVSALLVVPRPLRDGVYRVVAAIRHRLAGRSNACDVPPPEIRERMI
jgi:predicted DCC family thiol-disulfide oxidoreductase YuxK